MLSILFHIPCFLLRKEKAGELCNLDSEAYPSLSSRFLTLPPTLVWGPSGTGGAEGVGKQVLEVAWVLLKDLSSRGQ